MALSNNCVYVICLTCLLAYSLAFTLANARHNPSPAPEVYSPTTAPAPKVDSPTANPTPTGDGLLRAFDVTKYGALADAKTDSKSAFQAAWTDACKHTGDSTFIVPRGEFLLGPYKFASELIMLDPYETVKSWMAIDNLNPGSLIPAMMHYSSEPHAKNEINEASSLGKCPASEVVVLMVDILIERSKSLRVSAVRRGGELVTREERKRMVKERSDAGASSSGKRPASEVEFVRSSKRPGGDTELSGIMISARRTAAKGGAGTPGPAPQGNVKEGSQLELEEVEFVPRSSAGVAGASGREAAQGRVDAGIGFGMDTAGKGKAAVITKGGGRKQNTTVSGDELDRRLVYVDERSGDECFVKKTDCSFKLLTGYQKLKQIAQIAELEKVKNELANLRAVQEMEKREAEERQKKSNDEALERMTLASANAKLKEELATITEYAKKCKVVAKEAQDAYNALSKYMMSMHEEAIALALQVDPDLAMAEVDNVEDDEELRKKLWIMVVKHVIEQEKGNKRENLRKAIAYLKRQIDC
ncbi:hypothetical protein IFM89_025911 [Coptis chinensis]|uniref:Uncharacterized protein n=1 Tax=Coptis chinensis TaxID=261450 RepID=A0A835HF49_9MAGN|nr:hypothetical protein IFM89_025911 [Coptis chinensis]